MYAKLRIPISDDRIGQFETHNGVGLLSTATLAAKT